MRRFFVFVSICYFGIILFSTKAFASAVYEIDFSSNETLKPVFDSGLRPWRIYGLEAQKCMVENTSVKIKIGNTKLPRFDAEWIDFGVVKNNLLSRVEAVSKNLSLSEVRELIKPYLVIANAPQSLLEEYLKIVEAYPGGFSKDYGVGQKGNPNWGVSFRKTFNDKKPLNMVLVITWTRKTKDYRYLETPIPPPPGYEGVNMDAPPRATPVPQSDAPTAEPKTSQPEPIQKAAPKPSATPSQSDEEKQPSPWIWIILALAILIGSIALYFRKNKNS